MERPSSSFLHHPPRYVPLSHPSPSNFPQDGRFHHSHHLPPPPPPPPPISNPQFYSPLPPAPPPPPYTNHQSQFTFLNHSRQNHRRSIGDDPRKPQFFEFSHQQEVPPPPRVSDRVQLDDYRPRPRVPEFDNVLRETDPLRVLPESRLARPGLHEPYHHHRPFNDQMQSSPYRTAYTYMQEVENHSRFTNDNIGEFPDKHVEEFLPGRIDDYGQLRDHNLYNSAGHSGNSEFGESHVVSSPNSSRNLVSNRRGYEFSLDSLTDSGRFLSDRDENWRRDHARPPSRELSNSQIGMINNDFDKDVTRVSSLRRLSHDSSKFASRGNREVIQETYRSPRKNVQKKSALLRIQHGKPCHRIRNTEQQFTSAYYDNSHPSSFRGKDPHPHSYHRTEEARELSPVELDVSFKSNALVAKPIVAPSSDLVVSDRNLTHRKRKMRKVAAQEMNVANSPLTKVDKDPVKMDNSPHVSDCLSNSQKDTKQERKLEDPGSGCDIGSRPCSNQTSVSPGRMVSVVGDSCVPSCGTPSRSARKKKKITSLLSGASCSQLKEKHSESVNADSFQGFQATVAKKYSTGTNTGTACSPDMGRKSKTLDLGLSSPPRTKVDEGTANALVHELHTISYSDQDITELQNEITLSEFCKMGDTNHQSYQNAALAADHVDADLSSVEVNESHESLIQVKSSVHEVDNAWSSNHGLVRGAYTDVLSIEAVNGGSKSPSINEVNLSLKNCPTGCFPDSIASVGMFAANNTLTAEKPKICNGTVSAYGAIHDASACSDKDDDSNKQSCPGGAIMLPKNGPADILPVVKLPFGGNPSIDYDIETASVVKRKREVKNIQSGLSSARMKDTSNDSPSTSEIPVNEVSSIHFVKEFIVGEEDDVCSGPGEDNLSASLGPNRTSPKSRKKRKVCAPGFSSLMLSDIQEWPVSVDTSTTRIGVPFCDDEGLMPLENDVAASSNRTEFSVGLLSSSNLITVLHEKTVEGRSFEAVNLKNSVPEHENDFYCPQGSGGELKEDASRVMDTANYDRDTIIMETVREEGEVAAAHPVSEDGMLQVGTAKHGIRLQTQAPELDLKLPASDMECSYPFKIADSCSMSDSRTSCGDGNYGIATKSSDGEMESVPGMLCNIGSPEVLSIKSGLHVLDANLSLVQTSNEKLSEDGITVEKHVSDGAAVISSNKTFSQDTKRNIKSGRAMGGDLLKFDKTGDFPFQVNKKSIVNLNSMGGESKVVKNQSSFAVPRVPMSHLSSQFTPSKRTAPSSHIVSRTWHRTGSPSNSIIPGKNIPSNHVSPQGQLLVRNGKINASYVRKGNSLVRKPSPASIPYTSHVVGSSVHRLNHLGRDETKKSTESQSQVDNSSAVDRPKTPPLPHSSKLSNCATTRLGDLSSNGCSESASDLSKLKENLDGPKASSDNLKFSGTLESQIALSRNFDRQTLKDEGNMESEKLRVAYVKRKSNQLVAASSSSDLSVQDVENTQALSSGAYYKRRKNQLVRKTVESHIRQRAAISEDCLQSDGLMSSKVIPSRSFSKGQSGKGIAKTYKRTKFSWVWTLCEARSSKKDSSTIRHQMVWPQLFPWKRATYSKSFMHNSGRMSNISSLSNISQKLLLFRKRDTIYTRSARGYSLRRSKVLGVGGSSLKWSKSIEKNSRKANEEATLAVVAAVKKKKEHNIAAFVAGMKSRNNSSRERIFRIGSVRYKMDPTRRTLQRISDDESSCSATLDSGRAVKKSYVPRRLVIGEDEYVRIGNGNQLIRDPKRRTRVLASERVRWSLHTARSRLAKKRKYCQFFTRFGKCNKDDGKCPYMHDPSKIAVCTKFLRGACSNSGCKLTHKIIPERMQDCSYFLQGMCSNESCPYRHVNVNRNASICEGFLRGYCADGNECRKKHSYVCPVFEATGICAQGSKCKLHHPKNRAKGKKRKSSREQNNQGRYFGSGHVDVAECRSAVSKKHSARDNDDISFKGQLADYISVDLSDEEEVGETNDLVSQQTTLSDDDPFNVQVEDIDELIKPVHIMNRSFTISSSLAVDSPSERTASYMSEESVL